MAAPSALTMRRSRWLFNVLLALVVIGLGVTLWLSQQSTPPPAPPPVSDIALNDIQRISVRHDNNLVTLKRTSADRAWRLVAPASARPDPVHIASLMTLARAHAGRDYPLGAIPDTTTGLGHQAVIVRFNQAAPIRLGGPGPAPGTRYVATAHRLLLVSLPDIGTLDDSWTHWVDPALLAPNTRLTRMVLPDFTLTRDDQGHWQARPVGQRSQAAARTTISAWKRAKALTVVPADHSRQRIARITLGFADAPARHLDIIERNPNLILRDPRLDVDYHLAGNRVAPLLDLKHPGLSLSRKNRNLSADARRCTQMHADRRR